MHVCIDPGYVLDQSVARSGKMGKTRFQTGQKFRKGQSIPGVYRQNQAKCFGPQQCPVSQLTKSVGFRGSY